MFGSHKLRRSWRHCVCGPHPCNTVAQLLESPAGPQDVADPVIEDEPVDRLGNEIGCTRIVSAGDRRYIIKARHHHDRNISGMRAAAQSAAQLVPVHPRHHDVGQHQVRPMLFVQFVSLDPIAGRDHVKTVICEGCPRQRTHDRVVIDDQHRDHSTRMRLRRWAHRRAGIASTQREFKIIHCVFFTVR
jgi:hypothetical protein